MNLKNVKRAGWISLLNDLGSEVLTRLIPFYVSGILGASMSAVGAIEGAADSVSTILKPVFGVASDRIGKRKPFVVLGYGLSAFARPFLALSGGWPWVALLRVSDRLGKGIRTAPRDALIADSSSKEKYGHGFGLNRAMDTAGALLGVVVFAAGLIRTDNSQLTPQTWLITCFACSVPGLLATAVAWKGLAEVEVHSQSKASLPEIEVWSANPVFRHYLYAVALFSLANSSDAFILLRAKQIGYSLPATMGMLALLNLVSSTTALPAAALSDRFGRRTLVAAGWIIYSAVYFVLGTRFPGLHAWILITAIAIYGLFFGFTEGVERAWIADLVPPEQRGKGYGIFGLITGLAALPASLGFGWVWDRYGASAAFFAGSALSLLAMLVLLFWMPRNI